MDFSQIDISSVAISFAVLLFSLSLHESAHAWVAEYFGDPTGRRLGRVSLNPVVHIDPIGTLLFPLIGLLFGGIVFGWAKPVPVNSSRLRDPRLANILIAAAGPGSNVAAAIGFLFLLKLLVITNSGEGTGWSLLEPLQMVCQVGLLLNTILAVFNLIPVPPLDGSWILSGILPAGLSRYVEMLRPYGFLLLLGLLYTGVIGAVIRPIIYMVRTLAFN